MRVHELAKELGASSKEVLAKLAELGVEAKSHMSTVEEDAVALLREDISAGEAGATAKATPEETTPSKAEESSAEAETQPAAPTEEPTGENEASEEVAEDATAPSSDDVIILKGAIVVKDLAEKMGLPPNRIVAELMQMNVLAAINQRVEIAIARKIAEKHGFKIEHEKKGTAHQAPLKKGIADEPEKEDRPEDLKPRPPVVTVLGHVDHGKTSLLDQIRNTAVAKGEAGGITQHIGASTIDIEGRQITFLDTPGHAAFTAMRARGANLTDIAIIIIAADDGIMPQTREAIKHVQAAGVTMMVAINKIDLPSANVTRVKQQLQTEGLSPEEWGGELMCCEISAETGEGIPHLLEMILLQAEMLELTANPSRRAEGFVIEAQMEPGRGPTAHLLVTRGTLKVGDALLIGPYCGNVRALLNDHGVKIKKARPSTPVKCLGLSGVPEAGAAFHVCKNDRIARNLAAEETAKLKEQQLTAPRKTSLESLFKQLEEDEQLELKIVLKADTQGSVEAIEHALGEINSEKVTLKFVLSGTGNVTENDVMLASASDAVVVGFHVGQEPGAGSAAKREGVQVRQHEIIYELIDEVRNAMLGMLAPEVRHEPRGKAEVRKVFRVGKSHVVAGCLVVQGVIRAAWKARVLRNNEVLYDGSISSLKHFQDDVPQVREAQECGIRIDNFPRFEEGDMIECYEVVEVAQTL